MDLDGRTVAITGASSGIGAACADAFAEEGCRLALCARRQDRLREIADRAEQAGAIQARADRVDVTDPARVRAWADDVGEVDVVVANAGVGQYGAFLDADDEDLEQVASTNLLGVWRTVRAFSDALAASDGQAIVVGSMVSWVPMPYMSAYAATKAALTSWTRSVRPELTRRGIDLTLLCPGATATEFPENALRAKGTGYRDLKEAIGEGWAPERVARACVACARRHRAERKLTWTGRIGMVLGALVPNTLARILEPATRPGRRDDDTGESL